MAYKPKIIAGKVNGTGYPIDGHTLIFSLWDYDNYEWWHLYGWEDPHDEAVMLTMYEIEKENAERNEEEAPPQRLFRKQWKRQEWQPDAPFVLPLDVVEVVEVIQEEEKDGARSKLIAHGFDLSPRHPNDEGGILCLPMEKNLNGDIKAKHPDWELIECPNCGRNCWKHPEADVLQKEKGVQLLCTECALGAGLMAPFRRKNAPKPGGNREQRRKAAKEQRSVKK